MSKTKRHSDPLNGWITRDKMTGVWHKVHETKSDHDQYIPHRWRLSKIFQQHDIHYQGSCFNGHKPQTGAKRVISKILRAKVKEEVREEIDSQIEENEK